MLMQPAKYITDAKDGKMTYKIFFSHTVNDKLVAEEAVKIINNAFKGDISLYLACQEIGGGMNWKEQLKTKLHECDAIICLVTSEFVKKPWFFIEWSAFWIADKKFYILLSSDVKTSDLVHPMQENQTTNIEELADVRLFFKSLALDSNCAAVPYDHTDIFVSSIKDAIYIRDREQMEKSFSRYKNNIDKLPTSDYEKKDIAKYFYDHNDLIMFENIIRKIRDESVKTSIAIDLLHQGDLVTPINIADRIQGADKLYDIICLLIDLQHHDSPDLLELIEHVAHFNQAELRKIAIYLLKRGESDCELFTQVISLFTNMAELKKLPISMIRNGNYKSDLFMQLLAKVVKHNQREAEKIMNVLFEADVEFFKKILSMDLFTMQDIISKLKKWADDHDNTNNDQVNNNNNEEEEDDDDDENQGIH
jgi:hypothetical protein